MKKKPQEMEEFYARDRKSWRKWLSVNHEKKEAVWLRIYKKNSAIPGVTYEDAVEEALCFGWIDSRPQKKDDDYFLLQFSRRRPKSVWSAINKKRIEKLIAGNLMMPAGQAAIEKAKENGSWTKIDRVEALEMPDDLTSAFKKNTNAFQYFNAFPDSVKKGIYQWIESAGRVETREKRILETVMQAEKNIRANQWKKRVNGQ